MQKISTTQFGGIKVTMFLSNTKKPTWSQGDHDHYLVKIEHEGKSHIFDFWGSIADKEKSQLVDVKNALNCFASDCDMGEGEFKDFIWKTGCFEDSENLKSFKACQKSHKALTRLNIPKDVFLGWLDGE